MDSHGFEFAWRIWCLDIVQMLRVLQRVNSKLLSSPPFHPYLWCLQGMLNQSSDVNCIWLILIVFVFLKILTVWDTLGNFEGPSAERQCGPAKRSVQITGTLICHQTGLRSSHKTTLRYKKRYKKSTKKHQKTVHLPSTWPEHDGILAANTFDGYGPFEVDLRLWDAFGKKDSTWFNYINYIWVHAKTLNTSHTGSFPIYLDPSRCCRCWDSCFRESWKKGTTDFGAGSPLYIFVLRNLCWRRGNFMLAHACVTLSLHSCSCRYT